MHLGGKSFPAKTRELSGEWRGWKKGRGKFILKGFKMSRPLI
jgi:hypothetical protein